MRVLFTCWPFEGHVFGQMSVATALLERGHEVAFYTHESARSIIESAGIPMFPFSKLQSDYYLDVQEREKAISGRKQSIRVGHQAFRDWIVESIPDQVADISQVIDEWHPDVIATDLSMWGPPLVLWESRKIPVAISSTMMGPMIPGPQAPPWGFGFKPPRTATGRALGKAAGLITDIVARGLRKRVDEIRGQYGLGPMGCSVNEFTGRLPLYLVANLPELDYGRTDLPSSVHYVGSCVWHPPEQRSVMDWLQTIPQERPWVHVTEGTSHYQSEPFLLQAAVKGLSGAPLELIATTGSKRDPAQLGLDISADNVHVTRWVSHSELLPRSAAVITTGGQATVMSSLLAGVPVIVVPTSWDKPDNARRVDVAGVGIRLTPKQCTPERLRQAVDRVLTEPHFAANARRLGAELTAAQGPKRAAEQLELLGRQEIRTS